MSLPFFFFLLWCFLAAQMILKFSLKRLYVCSFHKELTFCALQLPSYFNIIIPVNLWNNRSSLKILCTWVSDSLIFLIPIFHVLLLGLYFLIKDFTIDMDKPWRNTRTSQDLVGVPPIFLFGVSILRCPLSHFFGVYP